MGNNRSSVVKNLKEYLVREAKAKREVDIPETFLKRQGMSAKGIPNQTNFSDCGVFLLIYLLIFFREPTEFMSKLLTRTLDVERDFAEYSDISSYRNYLRAAILLEYDTQDSGKYLPIIGIRERQELLDILAQPQLGARNAQATERAEPATSTTPVNAVSRPFKSPMNKNSAASTTESSTSAVASGTALNVVTASPAHAGTCKSYAVELAHAPAHDLPDDDDESKRDDLVRGHFAEESGVSANAQLIQAALERPHVTNSLLKDLNKRPWVEGDREYVPKEELQYGRHSRQIDNHTSPSKSPTANGRAHERSRSGVGDTSRTRKSAEVEHAVIVLNNDSQEVLRVLPAVQVKRTPPASQEALQTQSSISTEDTDMLDNDNSQQPVPMAEDSLDTTSWAIRHGQLRDRLNTKSRERANEHSSFEASPQYGINLSSASQDTDIIMPDAEDELSKPTTADQLGRQ